MSSNGADASPNSATVRSSCPSLTDKAGTSGARLAGVIDNAAALDPSARSAQQNHRELVGIYGCPSTCSSRTAASNVEQGARAFLNGIQLARDVGDLFEENLFTFQPIGGVGVRKQMVNHVIHAKIRKRSEEWSLFS